MKLNKIHKQDCLEGMRELIKQGYTKYFDFIEIDPPYNIGKDKWDKFESHEKYIDFITEVMELSSQLMSDNGTLFLWHNDIEILSDFIQLIKNNTEFKLKQQCIWNKYYKYNDDGKINKQYGFLNGFIQSNINRSYQKMSEYALYYTKQDEENKCTKTHKRFFELLIEKINETLDFNTMMLCLLDLKIAGSKESAKVLTSYKIGKHKTRFDLLSREMYDYINKINPFNYTYEEFEEEYNKQKYTFNADKNNFRSCIWEYPMSKETKHKTEKPLQLYYDMLEVHTNKDSKCLFPFTGSGNNIISLLDINKNDEGNREYIGFETDEKWFDLINKRITNN